MDNITFYNNAGLRLSGVFQRGTNGKLVIMCHGFRSNRSSRGRFDRFSSTFQQMGYNVLRFDFGGCGNSDDRPLTLAGEVMDLTAAINYAVGLGFENIALYGHSLGARVCLEAYNSSYVNTLLLTGAGTGPVRYDWTDEFSSTQLKELTATGVLTLPVEDPYRPEIKIARQMLLDFEQCDQQELLSNITCPTLIVHGDQGEEEILMPLTKKGMKWLPENSKLEVIKGAQHSFMEHLNEVEAITCAWLRKHF
ncbi:alpha/beta hydrolase family protein [Halobacillus mangrovi]|uniref:alpha/beta hydrolase family protein n=1 Tax=Halobacillus mangrovi TaxID=402384 RepID=UPI003D98F946